MKLHLYVLLAAVVLAAGPSTRADPVADAPEIRTVRREGADAVIVAHVPDGPWRVTLEGRVPALRMAWQPLAVRRVEAGGDVTFRVPARSRCEIFRVIVSSDDPLPASFYTEIVSFPAEHLDRATTDLDAWSNPLVTWPQIVDLCALENLGDVVGLDPADREVVESDIWQRDGDRLFFFNQYRGLQVIDVHDPQTPLLTGTFPLAAAGEQMYLLGDDHVVLLATDFGDWMAVSPWVWEWLWRSELALNSRTMSWWWPFERAQSRVVVVSVADGEPLEVASVPIAGTITESRTSVTALDLVDPEAPLERGRIHIPGVGNVVSATDRYLFVAVQGTAGSAGSRVDVIDVSAPDGVMRRCGTVHSAGRVRDKFKMHLSGDVLSVVSERLDSGRATVLETFSLADPDEPAKLGELGLAPGERLYATRFDGDRAYVVTFRVIDPLWVVDLSDPAQPRVAGELEVPGWSTYIHPLGDRLVAVGIEDSRVAVSLFGVSDPANPVLLSKVRLGEYYSWSEANYDEKAVTILPGEQLILLPFQSHHDGRMAPRVQLIDLHADELVARGLIDHRVRSRRTAVHREHVLSVSCRELLTVDVADRDVPEVRARLELSWPVDRVLLAGEHLLEISNHFPYWDWGADAAPELRVAPANHPERSLNRIELDALPVLDALVDGERLVIVQAQAEAFQWWWDCPAPSGSIQVATYDVSALPRVRRIGAVRVPSPGPLYGRLLRLDTDDGVVLWAGCEIPNPFLWLGDALLFEEGILDWRCVRSPSYRVLAVGRDGRAGPRIVSDLRLQDEAPTRYFRDAFVAGRFLYVSRQTLEPDPEAESLLNARHLVDVVDYADAARPSLRRPVSVPGTLRALSHGGRVLYTQAGHGDDVKRPWLHALAYDGVAAHYIGSIELSWREPWPVSVCRDHVLCGIAADDGNETHALVVAAVQEGPRLSLVAREPLQQAASAIVKVDDLMAVRSGSDIRVYDADQIGRLVLLGETKVGAYMCRDLTAVDGCRDRGLFIPAQAFGVRHLALGEGLPLPPK